MEHYEILFDQLYSRSKKYSLTNNKMVVVKLLCWR